MLVVAARRLTCATAQNMTHMGLTTITPDILVTGNVLVHAKMLRKRIKSVADTREYL